ncbi:DUF445 domain-containing protein [Aquibacillus rhizosphaerae]|uniref:DUF445 family protein n=1 Tax=Aquibacillus rhizosphaerae TaxID=3051431 RepID=A0ABT7LA53_9BACI|nr:DUF445 family protein [Aquibacillus sp. LR5S19]MDL4842738.1 DUF445 family protein [Aquibacillus sp. LR5S19]
MTEILIVLMMVLIGAIIGGLTNSLAIKMLFRPYQPKYIGSWRIPLTPGLIPKRRDELAKQLGKMVVEHLLTAEGIKNKLNQAEFKQQLNTWVQGEIDNLLSKEDSVQSMLASFGVSVNEEDLRKKLLNWTENHYTEFIKSYENETVRSVLDKQWIEQMDEKVDQLAIYAQNKLITIANGQTTKNKINELVQTYLDGKGFLGNMMSSFLGNEGLADKIQPMIVEYIRSEEGKTWIEQIIRNEWNHLLDEPIHQVEKKVGNRTIKTTLGKIVSHSVPIEAWLQRPMRDWFRPVKSNIISNILPNLMDKGLNLIVDRTDIILENIGLEEIVEKQVAAFPIQRVEQLVLNISRKEFTLITYLGALLGGLIGLIQGIIVLLVG